MNLGFAPFNESFGIQKTAAYINVRRTNAVSQKLISKSTASELIILSFLVCTVNKELKQKTFTKARLKIDEDGYCLVIAKMLTKLHIYILYYRKQSLVDA